MKKLVSIFLSAVIICGLLLISACDRTEDVRKSDGKISVVTTIFPYYDFDSLQAIKLIFACCFRPEAIRTVMNPNRQILQQLKIAIFLSATAVKATNGLTEFFRQLKTKMSK